MSISAPDQYSRFFQKEFDDREIPGIPTGFQAFFGDPANMSQTHFMFDNQVFDIDIIRGDLTIAALIARGINGTLEDLDEISDQIFSSFSRVFPLIRDLSVIDALKIKNRIPGESPYSQLTEMERFKILAGKQHMTRIRRHMRSFEFLASLSILTGKQPAILDTVDVDKIYDWRRNAANAFVASPLWNAGSPTIIADIDTACDKIIENGKTKPDMIIIGEEAMVEFLEDPDVLTFFDNRRINQGNIDINAGSDLPPRFLKFTGPGGLEPRGRIMTRKGRELWVFTYGQLFERPKDTFIRFMDTKKVLVAWSGARADRYFGPGEALPPTRIDEMWYQDRFGFTSANFPLPLKTPPGRLFDPRMFTFYAIESEKRVVRAVTESAPIFATTMTDAFAVITAIT